MNFDRENWRGSYKALILLEHLLTHGPLSVSMEFQDHKHVIKNMGSFQYIDEKGFVFVFSIIYVYIIYVKDKIFIFHMQSGSTGA